MGSRRSGTYKPGARTRANGYEGKSGWVSRKRPAGASSASLLDDGLASGHVVELGVGLEMGGGGMEPVGDGLEPAGDGLGFAGDDLGPCDALAETDPVLGEVSADGGMPEIETVFEQDNVATKSSSSTSCVTPPERTCLTPPKRVRCSRVLPEDSLCV